MGRVAEHQDKDCFYCGVKLDKKVDWHEPSQVHVEMTMDDKSYTSRYIGGCRRCVLHIRNNICETAELQLKKELENLGD